MKKIILLSVLIMTTQFLFSQNWAPLNSSEKYCYETDTVGKISHVLYVNHMEETGDGTVYHMNKTCIPYNNGEGSLYLFNQQQFLLDKYTINENEHWFFEDTLFLPIDEFQSFKIIPSAKLYDTWLFTENHTATISEIGQMEILGELDSIKTISISSKGDFVLSKEHGIVNWRNMYKLIGIEGRDLGITVPGFDDLFAKITPGDVICYNKGEWVADETVTGWNSYCRYDIESLTRYADSVVIRAYIRSNTEYFWKNKAPEITEGMGDIVIKRSYFTDVYPNDTLLATHNGFPEGILISTLGTHKWGGLKKTQIIHSYNGCWNSSLLYHNIGLYSNELYDMDELALFEYSVNYGFLEYTNAGFEWGGYETLVGVIDDGVTIGEIYPIEMFVGNQEINKGLDFSVYPSPAQDLLCINTIESGTIYWQIFDISGEQILNGKAQKTEECISLDIQVLPPGIYILSLKKDDLISRKKFIKNN